MNATGKRVLGRRLWGVALLAALALVPSPPTASGQLVTFAARSCRDYGDIAANRARNNVQESLRDLGEDTRYLGGDAIRPSTELEQQSRCAPLPEWQFTLGTGYQSRAVTGPWGALSRVTNPFATSIVTRARIPLLDVAGRETGETLDGAVTVELTPEQARAATTNRLWAQGGTPADPVLDRPFPGRYGFGALRCALDNVNGDNVEYVRFPQGARHVFCYAYYVTPPPTSGTVVVRKQVEDPGGSALLPFHFRGNVSYTVGHDFTLSAGEGRPAQETFVRAATGPGDEPWTVAEDALPGWQLSSATCGSASGASRALTDLAQRSAAVTLAAGDVVTCTFVNRLQPPPAGLTLSKLTLGGVGSFPFAVSGPDDARQTLTTTTAGVAVSGEPLSLGAGDNRRDETLPSGPDGRWTVDDVSCDGTSLGRALPATVTLPAGSGRACLVSNRFTPSGSITIRKSTLGAAGATGFVIRPAGRDSDGDGDGWNLSARTTTPGVAVTASGDDTGALPLGRYTIVETSPTVVADGSWTLDSVVCDGQPLGSAQGRVELTLTADRPHADCLFVNRFAPPPERPLVVPPPLAPPPAPPQPPSPPSPPSPPEGRGGVGGVVAANGPIARLSLSKRVAPVVARPGQLVRYTIVVVNRGPHPARRVTGVETSWASGSVVRVRSSHGRCDTRRRPIVCRVGRIGVGRRVVVTVLARAGRPGTNTNRVAVNAATADPNLRDNRAAATLRVVRPVPPRYTG
jgi:hypothetical protein